MADIEANITDAPAAHASASASNTLTASGDANVAVAGEGGGAQQQQQQPLAPAGDHPRAGSGCVFVITGATRGMGRSLALELARRGHFIAGCGTNKEAVEAMQAELGDKHLVMVTDVVRGGHRHVAISLD